MNIEKLHKLIDATSKFCRELYNENEQLKKDKLGLVLEKQALMQKINEAMAQTNINIRVELAGSVVRIRDSDGCFSNQDTYYPMIKEEERRLVHGDRFEIRGCDCSDDDELWYQFKLRMYDNALKHIAEGLYTRMDLDRKMPFPADYVNSLPDELKLKIYRDAYERTKGKK